MSAPDRTGSEDQSCEGSFPWSDRVTGVVIRVNFRLWVRASAVSLVVLALLAFGPGKQSSSAATRMSQISMSWSSAGALVWHTHDVDPIWLGQQLRAAGFGWVAIYLGSAGMALPPDAGWIQRFVRASALPVGGWTWLAGYPHADAGFAATQLKKYGLSFYIANAEAPYQNMPGASAKFVVRFRGLEPSIPAALSSLCDARGIGLAPWAKGHFEFLPQAYVNDFGASVSPAACVNAARGFFPLSAIHPTVGSYDGLKGWVSAPAYVQLLAGAGTIGFSVFPAEAGMTAGDWQTYGRAIASMHIAQGVGR